MKRKVIPIHLIYIRNEGVKETDGQGIGTEVNLLIERKRRKTKLNQRFNLKRHVIASGGEILLPLYPHFQL